MTTDTPATGAQARPVAVRRRASKAFIAGAALTTLAGAVVQLAVIPTADVADDRRSYPWTSAAFVAVSLGYLVLHVLVAMGLAAFGRSHVVGTSQSARIGVALAVSGTLTLAAGEVASLPIRDALIDDTAAQVVGAFFGLGVLLSAVGLLLVGKATLAARVWNDWRRYTPLAAGSWTAALIALPALLPTALPGGVAIYGALPLAIAIALRSEHSLA